MVDPRLTHARSLGTLTGKGECQHDASSRDSAQAFDLSHSTEVSPTLSTNAAAELMFVLAQHALPPREGGGEAGQYDQPATAGGHVRMLRVGQPNRAVT